MEKNRNKHLWCLLFLLPFGFILAERKCRPDNSCTVLPENLSCYTDYNHSISCMWNSTHEHQDSACTLEAVRQHRNKINSSCQLRSEDPSSPVHKTCTLPFKYKYTFVSKDVWLVSIKCDNTEQVVSVRFKPRCHVKLNPPPKPKVNLTTVVWFPQGTGHVRLTQYRGQLQLRQLDEPWMDLPLFKECKSKGSSCSIQLPDHLIKGETYEARIRVQPVDVCLIWSDWSRAKTWVATVGREKPTPASPPVRPDILTSHVTLGTLAFLVMVALTIILARTDRTTWIYIVKLLRGPPLPHPGKSFLQEEDFMNPKAPPFSSESFHSLVKPVEIAQVEVTSAPDAADAAAPTKRKEKTRGVLAVRAAHPSTRCSFSNPVYAHLSPQLPSAPPLASGILEACGADTADGCHSAAQTLEQDEESAILRLLTGGNCESTFVISDYETVERAEQERVRLQSLDSGVGTAEEVSQESLEADSVTKTADEDEDEKEREENDFQKLFGGGGVVDKSSIQVCSGYNQIQKTHNDAAELLSLDSGVGSGCGRLMNLEDSLAEEDEAVLLLSAPHGPGLQRPSSALASLALKLPGADFGGPGEMTPLMSSARAASELKPCADEYLPVRVEGETDAENL